LYDLFDDHDDQEKDTVKNNKALLQLQIKEVEEGFLANWTKYSLKNSAVVPMLFIHLKQLTFLHTERKSN